MSTTVSITNYSTGPYSHPQFVGGIASLATKALTLKQVNADDYAEDYPSAAKMGVLISVDGSTIVGNEDVTGAGTIADTSQMVTLDSTAGVMTVVMPAVGDVGEGFQMTLVFVTDGGDVTLDGDGAETVLGGANHVFTTAGEILRLKVVGTDWAAR
jgi:hypothetical protein